MSLYCGNTFVLFHSNNCEACARIDKSLIMKGLLKMALIRVSKNVRVQYSDLCYSEQMYRKSIISEEIQGYRKSPK